LLPKETLGNVTSGRKMIKVEFIVLGFKGSRHDVEESRGKSEFEVGTVRSVLKTFKGSA